MVSKVTEKAMLTVNYNGRPISNGEELTPSETQVPACRLMEDERRACSILLVLVTGNVSSYSAGRLGTTVFDMQEEPEIDIKGSETYTLVMVRSMPEHVLLMVAIYSHQGASLLFS